MTNISDSTIPIQTSNSFPKRYSSRGSRTEKLIKSKGKTETTKFPLRLKCSEPPIPEKPQKCTKKKRNINKSDGSSEYVLEENEDNEDFCSFEEYENEDFDNVKQSDIFQECSRRLLKAIQEYLDFKAARCIQRFAKGWLVRRKLEKKRKAAIVIQKEWRRFYYQRYFYQLLENKVQLALTTHYFKAAQKIQAVFRGWWVRQHIHDHSRLIQIQITAGEDLLHCVAFKLHHLLRTYQIPGVFSLKDSRALSKVEELLASMSFKQCNDRIRWDQQRRRDDLRRNHIDYNNSKYGVRVPFYGPNAANICEPRCLPLFTAADADHRMMKILKMFEEASREDPKLRKLKSKRGGDRTYQHLCMPPPTTFCGDVVRSMRKWKIVNSCNLVIKPDVFQNPQNVASFLGEIRSWWDILHGNCLCRNKFANELKLHKNPEKETGSFYYQNPCNNNILPTEKC